jgi:hypothetical protein
MKHSLAISLVLGLVLALFSKTGRANITLTFDESRINWDTGNANNNLEPGSVYLCEKDPTGISTATGTCPGKDMAVSDRIIFGMKLVIVDKKQTLEPLPNGIVFLSDEHAENGENPPVADILSAATCNVGDICLDEDNYRSAGGLEEVPYTADAGKPGYNNRKGGTQYDYVLISDSPN